MHVNRTKRNIQDDDDDNDDDGDDDYDDDDNDDDNYDDDNDDKDDYNCNWVNFKGRTSKFCMELDIDNI